MPTVNSVLGPLDTAKLGFTLTHEHIAISSAGIPQVYPEFFDHGAKMEAALAELRAVHALGVRTIVDVTTLDLGRDIRFMREVSRRSGVQVVAATGIWRDIPRAFWTASPDRIASLFVREIEKGIEGTEVKAGIIKVANDQGGVTPEGEIILRAAARAHKATGVPISTHHWAPERVGEQQVRVFEDEGVDLNRVYIGHSSDTTDVAYLTGLLEKGVWLGIDRLPGRVLPETPRWPQRAETVKKLFDAGWARRVMISHDWPMTSEAGREYNPDGLRFIPDRFIPRLLELGVSRDAVRLMTVDNARRFFEGSR